MPVTAFVTFGNRDWYWIIRLQTVLATHFYW